jgi:hypothetical protein
MEYEWKDVTKQCSKIVNEIRFLNTEGDNDPMSTEAGRFTLRHFANVFSGVSCKKAIEEGAFEKFALRILNLNAIIVLSVVRPCYE